MEREEDKGGGKGRRMRREETRRMMRREAREGDNSPTHDYMANAMHVRKCGAGRSRGERGERGRAKGTRRQEGRNDNKEDAMTA